jgi:hypothetical protein
MPCWRAPIGINLVLKFLAREKKKQRLKPEHFIGLERWGRVQERGGEVDISS